MGTDIWLLSEGYINGKWINIDKWYRKDGYCDFIEGFDYVDLIDGNRDYELFYLLAGVRGDDERKTYPPIKKAKGIPMDMDYFIKNKYESYHKIDFESKECVFHDASYLTLKEIKDSGYGDIMTLKGYVDEEEYSETIEMMQCGIKCQMTYVDVKDYDFLKEDLELKEWKGYINGNLIHMIDEMENLKKERRIKSDEEIRIVFWFGS